MLKAFMQLIILSQLCLCFVLQEQPADANNGAVSWYAYNEEVSKNLTCASVLAIMC